MILEKVDAALMAQALGDAAESAAALSLGQAWRAASDAERAQFAAQAGKALERRWVRAMSRTWDG